MAQLGSDVESQYPNVIDTRQVYRNGTVPLPDSDTRLDAQAMNGALSAIINIETALGAGVQGSYGSLAARMAALEAGGVGGTPLTNVVGFTEQTVVSLPGSAHQQGQQALFYAVYDAATPHNALAPSTFNMYSTTFNAVVTFAVPQSGTFMVAALTPDYETTFATPGTPPYDVTILGSTHGLAEPYPFVQVYDAANPAQAVEPGSIRVNSVTSDVTLSFTTAHSGRLVLAEGTPRYQQAFTNQTTVTIPGATHGLGSANLLHTVYTTAGSDVVKIEAGSLSVHPTTFEVVLGFAVPQSGTLVLAPVPTTTPVVFAMMPLSRTLTVPTLATTRRAGDERGMAQLQRSVESLSARLVMLEAAYAALLAQQPMTVEESAP